MRVGFFGQSGPYAPEALRLLLAETSAYEIVLVVEAKRPRASGLKHRLRKPLPGRDPGGENLGAIGRAAGIPLLETQDVNAATAVATVAKFDLDLIVCVGFDRLFSLALLATARHGGVNAHPSALPAYRGPAPLFWQLRDGVRDAAMTLHIIDSKEDHGPIVAQQPYRLQLGSGADLYQQAGHCAGIMLPPLLGTSPEQWQPRPQDHRGATRAPRPTAEDAYIDPSAWGADDLVFFATGAPFFRTPWMRLGADVFYLRRGIEAQPGRMIPGQYVLQRSTLAVRTRDGVALLEVQI